MIIKPKDHVASRSLSSLYATPPGRQMDLEILRHVSEPVRSIGVTISPRGENGGAPRGVTGIQKAAQMYLAALLEDDSGNPSWFGMLLEQRLMVNARTFQHYFNFSNTAAINRLRAARTVEYATGIDYGPQFDDEAVNNAELIRYVPEPNNTGALLHIRLTTLAGRRYSFISPSMGAFVLQESA